MGQKLKDSNINTVSDIQMTSLADLEKCLGSVKLAQHVAACALGNDAEPVGRRGPLRSIGSSVNTTPINTMEQVSPAEFESTQKSIAEDCLLAWCFELHREALLHRFRALRPSTISRIV